MKEVDVKILKAIQTGKGKEIFHLLYESAFPKIDRFIQRSGGQFDDSKDVFQETVLVFYKSFLKGKYKHDTEIDGYLFGVSRNLWYAKIKKEKRLESLNDDYDQVSSDHDPSQQLITTERENFINQAFLALGEVCNQLLQYTFYEKLSMKEVCEKMNFSNENSAKTKNYKCKQRLMKLLKENSEFKELLSHE